MVTTIVLLHVESKRIKEAAEEISALECVSEVYSVTGQYDLAAIVRAPDTDSLAETITGKVLKVEGIIRSESLFAFRVYSKHDLEGMFSVGE